MTTIMTTVHEAFLRAGAQLKEDLWREDDLQYLQEQAKELAMFEELSRKAVSSAEQAAFKAAAKTVLTNVMLLAVMRTEATQHHVQKSLGMFFLELVSKVASVALAGVL